MSTIWEQVLDGNIAAVLNLLGEGVGVDERNWLGETPLLICARHGLEEMASALLDAGASVHVKDWESGWTPLHRSLYFGHVRLSLLLLQAGALMDGGRSLDPTGRGERQKHRARSRSRSESLATPTEGKNRSAARQRNDGLGDGEGNSPLDVLSLELRPQLKAARESGLGGDVFSFGKADFTLGYPTSFGRADVVRPRRIEALANLQVTRVSASKYHSAAVTKCGLLYTWGHGKSGRLGHGDEVTCMLPTRVEGLAHHTVTEVATAESHTVALTSSGEVFSWGRDRFGQLGHGSGSNGRHAPKRVESLKKFAVVGVATGAEHTAVVTRSGNCYTFGRNNHGQLGLAGVKETRSPRVVSGLSSGASRGAGGVGRHVIKVSASARSTMVITRGVDRGSGLHPVNEVFSWGLGSHVPSRVNFNSDRGAASSSSRWQTHDARIDIVDIAAARCHNIALDRIGRVFSWGFGADNLGLQPRETRTERGPQLVAGLLPFNCGGNPVHISASDQHSCVVTDAGDLYTWGTCDEEGGGALGHSHERWQPVAKRVPLLKKVVSVAAAPDHTVVLCAASCPSLPHGASFSSASPRSETHVEDDQAISEEADEDAEVDVDSEEEAEGLPSANSAGMFEPLTLKQACEAKLAQEVDLHNAGALLAYADALDAPALVRFCTEFVRRNLDGILVMGRESDRSCLLEASASGAVASSLERGAQAQAPASRASAAEGASPSPVPEDKVEEGLDPELEATALARAEMRSKTPSAKEAARAVRSLKKKIARIREWEQAKERGEELSSEQVSKVSRRSRMEDDLTSLESQLERAKLAHSARCSRLEASKASKTGETFPSGKRVLFPESDGQTTLDPDLQGKMDQWTPQLDLSQDEMKANDKRPIICEVCSVECANANMYADHLRGKRHRATTLRLEQQLEKVAQPELKAPPTWGDSSAAASSSPATASKFAKGANSGDSSKGRRASCSDANLPSRSSQSRREFNQLPRGGEVRTMRQTLEDQQRAATVCMADKGKEATADAAQAMNFLRTTGKSHGRSQQLPSKHSPSPQEAGTSPVYSLADFIAPGSKKQSRPTKGREKVRSVWGEESKTAAAKPPSFNHILHEESEAKKHFDEYGDSAWFVSGKPRSTSFEGIVAAQRREEREAEREAEEENLRQIEENMLILVMEMSKNETGNTPPVPSRAQGKGGRRGRGAHNRKEVPTPRNRNGRNRRPKQNAGADKTAADK